VGTGSLVRHSGRQVTHAGDFRPREIGISWTELETQPVKMERKIYRFLADFTGLPFTAFTGAALALEAFTGAALA